MKIFKRTDRKRLSIIRLAYIWHFVAAVVLPLLLIIISYGMCHGTKPSDACGDAIGFGVGPVFFILDAIVAAIAGIISFIAFDAILILLTSLYVIDILTFMEFIPVPIGWHYNLFVVLSVLYTVLSIIFCVVSESTKNSKYWLHKHTFVVSWFAKRARVELNEND